MLHSCDKAVLGQFIEAARQHYTNASISRVTVHLTDNYGSWARAVTKNRRAFSTLILPSGIKELLLADAKEFLASEEWWVFFGWLFVWPSLMCTSGTRSLVYPIVADTFSTG
jgi:chaperone BCS1